MDIQQALADAASAALADTTASTTPHARRAGSR